ncbi:hypothetical protein [Thioclava sp. F28-4]|uniref:hypothetical protein n=1 Tax=Thioclava sp. F28-4 TaxID=1915315 RepID=UPI0009965E32|nr:hypothetical protein [Thioclava sp. F28-4]OOY04598.1 hypothetical protein BMI87_10275 [Thioclava sp. F28-4]
MGLTVAAFKNARRVNAYINDENRAIERDTGKEIDAFKAGNHPFYQRYAPEFVQGQLYTFDEIFRFEAGSYSYYADFREELAALGVAMDDDFEPWCEEDPQSVVQRYMQECYEWTPLPFSGLIAFSDCDGTLGCSAVMKLAQDFADHAHLAAKLESERFRKDYAAWQRALALASASGCIIFI